MIIFALMQNMGDPIATMGGRRATRPEDRARLTRQLGLDRPIYTQYLYWLVGNDWALFDADGDGVPETPGTRQGVLRGDFGTSMINRGKPVWEVIWERVPNTLLLMVAAEVVILVFSVLIGVYSALHQYSLADNVITAVTFIGYSMPIFFIALLSIYIFFYQLQALGIALPAGPWACLIRRWVKRRDRSLNI
ncbi:MAG: ABC transporter permease [Chloroflexi bacterium]|nr:ABC transporter permease [Chloroflexota bacterium]